MRLKANKCLIFCGILLVGFFPARLAAQATLLLEEPYSYDGTFAGTGHTAIYLSRICADSPTHLRRCRPGETGVVLSRYHGIAGHDWLAIPLIPYLYAVQSADEIPLYADTRLVALMRERFISTLPLPPEGKSGEPRYELAGSAYDRTSYGFRFSTTPAQDDRLIEFLNSSPNVESYELVKSNCADFVKQIVNFYYPHAVHRSVIADLGVTTPKQAAKSLVHTSKRHPEMQLKRFIIPQVPGTKRSKPVHGLIESVVLAKKYVTPVLLFHPFVIGGLEAAYWMDWRFNPAKGAYIFDPNSPQVDRSLERPLTAAQRHAFGELVATTKKTGEELEGTPDWKSIESHSRPQIDANGKPFLSVTWQGREVPVGLCRGSALRLSNSPELVQQLALTRLDLDLKPRKPIRASEQEVRSDWQLLEAARGEREAALDPLR